MLINELYSIIYFKKIINKGYISNVEVATDDNVDAAFFYSNNSHEDLLINDSVFIDINIKSIFPLIMGDNINLK